MRRLIAAVPSPDAPRSQVAARPKRRSVAALHGQRGGQAEHSEDRPTHSGAGRWGLRAFFSGKCLTGRFPAVMMTRTAERRVAALRWGSPGWYGACICRAEARLGVALPRSGRRPVRLRKLREFAVPASVPGARNHVSQPSSSFRRNGSAAILSSVSAEGCTSCRFLERIRNRSPSHCRPARFRPAAAACSANLEDRRLLSGVTFITHGAQPPGEPQLPIWLVEWRRRSPAGLARPTGAKRRASPIQDHGPRGMAAQVTGWDLRHLSARREIISRPPTTWRSRSVVKRSSASTGPPSPRPGRRPPSPSPKRSPRIS